MKPSSLVIAGLLAIALLVLRRRLSRVQFVLVALVVVWFAVRGAGLVRLPDLEETAKDVGPALGAWTYLVVGVMAFLETAFFVGLVAPGEFTVIVGGFIAGQGVVDVFVLGAIVFVCAAAGDTTSFLLGRKLGRGFLLRHGQSYGINEARLAQIEQLFQAHATKAIVVGRFLGLVRALAPFVAGASHVPARRFLPITYLAAAIWSVTFVTLGYVFWRSFDTVVSIAKRGSLALGVLVTVIVAVVVTVRWLKTPGNRERLLRAWRTKSLKPLLDGR